ncbi:prephenate dehydrogenase [Xylophilus ampelinus]|nr:prephenate dehydrogenase [Xylophilus ampelinus]MCS4509897.1 prephenate dehydrogenase [Xylophilus ampelinus]
MKGSAHFGIPANGSVAVCGLGLIGGSVVRALRAGGFGGRIAACDIDLPLLQARLAEGWIDEIVQDPGSLFDRHDLVVLCQPVAALLDCIAAHAAAIGAGRAVVVDVASVKAPVVAALQAGGAAAMARFVPCHPIAGKAQHGWDASEAGLFQGKRCVITPARRADSQAEARAAAFWAGLGAQVAWMPAEQHDRIYAALSHLPQLLTYAYLHSLAARPEAEAWLAYQGTGFQGFTRLGGSDPALWADIAVHNSAPLVAEIDRLGDALGLIRRHLLRGDGAGLSAAFADARQFHGAAVAACAAGRATTVARVSRVSSVPSLTQEPR